MTTADGTHPAFSERHLKPFFEFPIFTDLYRHLTDIAEVHYTPITLNIVSVQVVHFRAHQTSRICF